MAHILLIDDVSGVRRSISSVLKSAGHTIVEAADGDEGIKHAWEQKFDLVITDIMMPGTDGMKVITTLKDHLNCPPILAISGGSTHVPGDLALLIASEKVEAALPKPLESQRFWRRSSNCCGRTRHSRREEKTHMAHILLIDDISGVRRSISSVLEAAGHKVTEAESGPEGLEAASARLIS